MGHGTGHFHAGGKKVAYNKKLFKINYLYYIIIGAPLLSGLLSLSTLAHGQTTHRCATEALTQAKALLIFHVGSDANVGVDDKVKVLTPLRNPVNRRQFLDVLEVKGFVYRANYQMRLIYAQIPGSCALMGQEILERSSP
jgi:hypothetical protein